MEAAVVAPLLLLLALGVVDIGRAFFDAARVQEAAQEGAYYASLNPGDPDEAIARAEGAIPTAGFVGSVTITCPSPDQVTVTVARTFTLITPIVTNIIGGTVDLSHSQTAAVLTSDPCTPSP